MVQSSLGGNMAVRAAEFILLMVTTLLVLQSMSPAQNNGDGRSIRAIGAVGNRDLGCTRGLGSRYSLKAQLDTGRSHAQAMEATSKLITDPVITEYVNGIAQTLARNSDAKVRFTVKIIDSDQVNAFSLPGGFIFVDSGLILAADDEAELAAVISHEIAHVAACHGVQEMAGEEQTSSASMPLIFRLAARHVTMHAVDLPPAGSFESEADFLAVEYLYKAGYDPQALPSFFEKVNTIQREKPGSQALVSESPRQIAYRIERTQREINTLRPPASEYKLDTSDFQEIKVRLSEVEKRAQSAVGSPNPDQQSAARTLPDGSKGK
jgi:predicted Zn-dependent protease